MFYSPLRYPGGKGKLEPFMELMIKKLNHVGGVYIEPFAGGAGLRKGRCAPEVYVFLPLLGEGNLPRRR